MRHIAHFDLDSFYVSVERIKNPALNNLPILIGSDSDRGVVASCSYETRKFGVRSAMSMKRAKELCPQAIIIRGDRDAYSYYSKWVTSIIEEEVPLVEKASIDEHYLDLSELLDENNVLEWTIALRDRIIKETGLPISFAIGSNKTIAKMGTDFAKPLGALYIKHGQELDFLKPLSIDKIPMVGQKATQILKGLGIDKIEQLQKVSSHKLIQIFGKNGYTFWERARGIDNSPVSNFRVKKSISKEHTYEVDVNTEDVLKETIGKMSEDLALELRQGGFFTGVLAVKIRYENFETVSKQIRISYTCFEDKIKQQALFLMKQLRDTERAVRLIGIRCSNLTSGSYQLDLFNDDVSDLNLTHAVDSIKKKYGPQVMQRVYT